MHSPPPVNKMSYEDLKKLQDAFYDAASAMERFKTSMQVIADRLKESRRG